MRRLLLLIACTALAAPTSIEIFGLRWTVPVATDWTIEPESGIPTLSILTPRPPQQGQPRRPGQFALAETDPLRDVDLEFEAQKKGDSVIIVFGYKDEAHFNYAHLSQDEAAKQPVHNGIFRVDGGDRVRISTTHGPAALPENDRWYKIRLTLNGKKGDVSVYVDGQSIPALHMVDPRLRAPGRVGVGSFFHVARFRNLKLLR